MSRYYTELRYPFNLNTPKGMGLCIGVINSHIDNDLEWTVIDDETGQIWTWPNSKVRGVKNITIQRDNPEDPQELHKKGEL